jgi:hypothetical protein
VAFTVNYFRVFAEVSGSFAGDAVEDMRMKGLEDLRKLAYHLDHLKESALQVVI